MKSLQDQLLKAGLVDTKKAKQVSKDKRKETNVARRSKNAPVNETKEAVLKAQQEKQQKDKELNLSRQAEADKKAIAAQVIQLIQHYKIKRIPGDIDYNFKDDNKVKTLRVDKTTSDEIIRGRLCIAKLASAYELIPKPIADKIRERDMQAVVVYNEKSADQEKTITDEDDDFYAQFEIPDDLMW